MIARLLGRSLFQSCMAPSLSQHKRASIGVVEIVLLNGERAQGMIEAKGW